MGESETDCRQVLERLFLYIDGEIAGADCGVIEAHLRLCEPCLQHVDFERAVKEFVRRRCAEGCDPPDGLADRLRSRLAGLADD